MALYGDGYGAEAVLSTNIYFCSISSPVRVWILLLLFHEMGIFCLCIDALTHNDEGFNRENLMANRFEKCQIDVLESAFEESEHLTREKKVDLVRTTGLDMEQIASWFNRKRACKRARKSIGDLERINAELQVALEKSRETESELQKKLNKSKQREAGLEAENQSLKQSLATSRGDLRIDSVLGFYDGYP